MSRFRFNEYNKQLLLTGPIGKMVCRIKRRFCGDSKRKGRRSRDQGEGVDVVMRRKNVTVSFCHLDRNFLVIRQSSEQQSCLMAIGFDIR